MRLDTWTRSDGLLTQAQAVDFAKLLVARAHSRGIAIGQKNAVEIAGIGVNEIGFDFAVVEECAQYDECQGYTSAYGGRVFVIEYADRSFTKACDRFGARLSIIRRDLDLTAPGSSAYAFRSC